MGVVKFMRPSFKEWDEEFSRLWDERDALDAERKRVTQPLDEQIARVNARINDHLGLS